MRQPARYRRATLFQIAFGVFYYESIRWHYKGCFYICDSLYYLHITATRGINRNRKVIVKNKTVTSVIQEVILVKKYFSVEAVKKSADSAEGDRVERDSIRMDCIRVSSS